MIFGDTVIRIWCWEISAGISQKKFLKEYEKNSTVGTPEHL